MHPYNPSIQEVETGGPDHEFEATLDSIGRPCLKKPANQQAKSLVTHD